MGRPVSRRGPQGGSVGTPTYIPQNDPHDAQIILNIHKWGKKIFNKKLSISSGSHQPRSNPEVGLGSPPPPERPVTEHFVFWEARLSGSVGVRVLAQTGQETFDSRRRR